MEEELVTRLLGRKKLDQEESRARLEGKITDSLSLTNHVSMNWNTFSRRHQNSPASVHHAAWWLHHTSSSPEAFVQNPDTPDIYLHKVVVCNRTTVPALPIAAVSQDLLGDARLNALGRRGFTLPWWVTQQEVNTATCFSSSIFVLIKYCNKAWIPICSQNCQ